MGNDETIPKEEPIEWDKVIIVSIFAFVFTNIIWLMVSPFLNLYQSGMNTTDLPFYHIYGTIIIYVESKITNRSILHLKGYPSCLMTACQLLCFFFVALFLKIGGVF